MVRESRHKRKRATRHDDREDAGERDLSASFLPANNNMRVTRSKAKHQNTSLVDDEKCERFFNGAKGIESGDATLDEDRLREQCAHFYKPPSPAAAARAALRRGISAPSPQSQLETSGVSTTTNVTDKSAFTGNAGAIECMLRCQESPLANHCELEAGPAAAAAANRANHNQSRHSSKRVVAPHVDDAKSSKHKAGAKAGAGVYDDQREKTKGVDGRRKSDAMASAKCCAEPSSPEELSETFRFIAIKDEETRPNPNYLQKHGARQMPNDYINGNMRTICCGWMVELSMEFKFQQETLMLAIRIFDRFLSDSPEPVPRKLLQLVAIASMLLASKMEEVVHPSVKDFSRMSADTFTTAEVKRMEVSVLRTLDYRIHSPAITSYVNIIREGTKQLSERTYCMASYLVELATLYYAFLKFKPALVAAAAAYVSKSRKWTVEMEALTEFEERDLRDCANLLTKVHQQACEACNDESPLYPLKEKYRMHSKMCVSNEKPLKTQL